MQTSRAAMLPLDRTIFRNLVIVVVTSTGAAMLIGVSCVNRSLANFAVVDAQGGSGRSSAGGVYSMSLGTTSITSADMLSGGPRRPPTPGSPLPRSSAAPTPATLPPSMTAPPGVLRPPFPIPPPSLYAPPNMRLPPTADTTAASIDAAMPDASAD